MALKLRRQTEVITDENLAHRRARRHPRPLGTGADSFKRVLDSAVSSMHDNATLHSVAPNDTDNSYA